MPSTTRRAFLASSSAVLLAASGCTVFQSSPSTSAHWVTVYLGEREETHDVTVTVQNDSGETLFEKSYRLSDSNEANENAPFPAPSDLETIIVTVDGTRFEYNWPGFEQRALPCDDPNQSGVELWIESGQDGTPELRMEADCQHVTMER